jgi:hypothetical protein
MSNTLPVKKIFVDSRYRTADSASDSDFRIQLGRNIYLPDDCIMHIESCVIPHTWYTIEKGINDGMYLKVVQGTNITYTIITIPSTNYTGNSLITALQTAFNSAYPGLFTVSYDAIKNTITINITNGNYFKVLTDNELSTYLNNTWAGLNYDLNFPASCNDIITNREINYNNSIAPFVSGGLNLQGFRSIYISSSNLSNFNTLGARGENDIIKKVITTSDFGYLIVSELETDHDYLDCSRMSLNTIDFRLSDVKGHIIPLHSNPVSFTIVFSIKP